MRNDMGDDFENFQTKMEELDQREPGIRDIINAYRDIGELVIEAKRAQVKALNNTDYSLAEYNWVREQVLAAAGYGVYQLGLEQIAQAAEANGNPTNIPNPELDIEVPEANIERVKPYLEDLPEYLGFAIFGL